MTDYVEHRLREFAAFEARAAGEYGKRPPPREQFQQEQNAMSKSRNQKGQFALGWSAGIVDKPRSDAKAQGLKRYMGKPCPHGHSGERYTGNTRCCECKRLEFAAYIEANREEYNAYALRYQHALPAEKLAAFRRNSTKNAKAWAKANPEKVKAGKTKFRLANMDRWRTYIRNRRARLAGVSGTHDHADIQRLRVEQKDRCAYCDVDLHGGGDVDHKTPLVRGGSNWPHNLQLLCATCNRKKHAKDPVEHARAIGILPPLSPPTNQEI